MKTPSAPVTVTIVVPVRDDPMGLVGVLSDVARCASPSDQRTLSRRTPGADRRDGQATSGIPRLLVVDDGSVDAAEVARIADLHGATVLRHETPRGPAAARNTGLAAVDTELVALVDSDVRFDGPWWTALLAHLCANPDASVVAVAPRVVGSEDPGRIAAYERRHGSLDLDGRPARVAPGTRVAYVPSAALLARTDALRSVSGFDESMRFGEDVDLLWRLVTAGGTVRYEPASQVRHRSRVGIRAWIRQRFDYGTSAAELDRRHPGLVAPVVISPWSALAWGAAAGGAPSVGAVIAVGSSVALAGKLEGVPAAVSIRLALRGHLGAGEQLLRAVLRPWWPLALMGTPVSNRIRVLVVASVMLRAVTTRGPVSDRVLAVLDDVAYSAGVWAGTIRARRVGALLPRMNGSSRSGPSSAPVPAQEVRPSLPAQPRVQVRRDPYRRARR